MSLNFTAAVSSAAGIFACLFKRALCMPHISIAAATADISACLFKRTPLYATYLCCCCCRHIGLEKNFKAIPVNYKIIIILKDLDKKHPYFTTHLSQLVEDNYYDRRGEFNDFFDCLDVAAEQIKCRPLHPLPTLLPSVFFVLALITQNQFA